MNPIAKIGFLIKGDYDPAVTYDFLDVVFYNGASYVAKKLTTGNTPVRKNEYWQIFAEGGTLTGTSDISDTTVAFQQAQERVNISTGESAKTLFGKIKKWFADLKGTAFSAPVTNLFATVTGNSLDATMGKNLKDLHDANKNEINALNASLRVQSASFLILGKAAQCIKFGKMVLITIDGKVTQSLQSGVWSEDFVLPFEPAYNTTWIGRISDYDQGLINANISVSFKSIKIRPTMDINVDHLIRFQIMYPCK